MNCPNCHCHRGEPLTVAVNSLVTRCHHAFHAVATAEAPPLNEPLHPQSPVTPDDFAQQKPAQDATACPTCNSIGDPHAAWCTHRPIQPPYTTPVPTVHDGSTGWVYCEACDAPQPVAGHECGDAVSAALDALRDSVMFRGYLPSPDGRRATIPTTRLREHLQGGGTISGLVLSGALVEHWGLKTGSPVPDVSPAHDAVRRAELAESLLCASAFEHGRSCLFEDRLVWCDSIDATNGDCVYCDAARGGGR